MTLYQCQAWQENRCGYDGWCEHAYLHTSNGCSSQHCTVVNGNTLCIPAEPPEGMTEVHYNRLVHFRLSVEGRVENLSEDFARGINL